LATQNLCHHQAQEDLILGKSTFTVFALITRLASQKRRELPWHAFVPAMLTPRPFSGPNKSPRANGAEVSL
jgi:hypothetical protein